MVLQWIGYLKQSGGMGLLKIEDVESIICPVIVVRCRIEHREDEAGGRAAWLVALTAARSA